MVDECPQLSPLAEFLAVLSRHSDAPSQGHEASERPGEGGLSVSSWQPPGRVWTLHKPRIFSLGFSAAVACMPACMLFAVVDFLLVVFLDVISTQKYF